MMVGSSLSRPAQRDVLVALLLFVKHVQEVGASVVKRILVCPNVLLCGSAKTMIPRYLIGWCHFQAIDYIA